MPRLLVSLLLLSLLGGCASRNVTVDRRQGLDGLERFFVVANANDNRALDRHLVNALRARGLTADSGPRTMMPEDTQAILLYEDQWSWDFGERLQILTLTVREPGRGGTLATAGYVARIPGRRPPAGIVGDLVTRLFTGEK